MPAGHYTPADDEEEEKEEGEREERGMLLQGLPSAASIIRSRDGAGYDAVPGGAGALYFGLDLSTPRDAEGNPTRVPVGNLL